MPADPTVAGSPQEWLRHARSDLALSRMRKSHTVLYEHLCFHAQQAAEKALKAVLIANDIRVQKTHDLVYLINALPTKLTVPPSFFELPLLNRYAVQQRYPGDAPTVTQQHRKNAVRLAEEALAWAEHIISARNGNGRNG